METPRRPANALALRLARAPEFYQPAVGVAEDRFTVLVRSGDGVTATVCSSGPGKHRIEPENAKEQDESKGDRY